MIRFLFQLFILLFLNNRSSFAQESDFKYTDSCLQIGNKKELNHINDFSKRPFDRLREAEFDSLYFFLNNRKNMVVELAFHTDQRGSDKYNLLFSQKIMDKLKADLVARGIDSMRIIAKGYGETKPLIPLEKINKLTSKEEIEKAYDVNRRSEVIIRDHTFKFSDTVFSCGAVCREYIGINDCKPGIHPGYYLLMDSIFTFLVKNESLTLEIGYHTDQRGSAAYNKKYSKLNADIILTYLIRKGLDPKRIVSVGYGESIPLIKEEEIWQLKTANERERLFSKNRRVEFKILSIH